MAKRRKEYEEDDFLDEVIDEAIDDDDEVTEADDFAEDSDEEEDEEDGKDDAEQEEEVVEEAETYPPDDKKAVAALRKLGVRLDVTEAGNVWRAIFDDTNGRDESLVLLKGLPALRELWIIGTKVTPGAAQEFKEERPKVTVFY